MVRVKIDKGSFLRRYQDRTRAFRELVKALPDRPSPDQIHDMRVATRRAGVVCRLLPREVRRTNEARGFDLALKSVRRATSQVRDIDTLRSDLAEFGAFLPAGLLVSLDNDRSDASARATKDLLLVPTNLPPAVDDSVIGNKRLSRRFGKMVKKRRASLGRLAGKVAADDSREDDLHALRVEAKKLRYLLELAKGSSEEVKGLVRWQNMLGRVHDLDVAMAYLERSDWDFPKEPALRELRRRRRQEYLRFVREYAASAGSPRPWTAPSTIEPPQGI